MIRLANVTLTFPDRAGMGIRDRLARVFSRNAEAIPTRSGFTALHDLSLDVAQGERLGIVGFNGAGKTTLLKTMCGIYPPTHGSVEVDGDVACLFELATGFEMEANGWENIRTRGLLLGLSPSEIRDRAQEIADFTELGDALDRPVKTYSSGMYVRLGFAVSTAMSPDVLLLDEVIAAGDQRFQEKALGRLRAMVEQASIMVLVSHDMNAIERMCDRAVWLYQGRIRADGTPRDVVAEYRDSTGS